jgi:hypothetical protein
MTSNIANPILYAWLNPTFREVVVQTCNHRHLKFIADCIRPSIENRQSSDMPTTIPNNNNQQLLCVNGNNFVIPVNRRVQKSINSLTTTDGGNLLSSQSETPTSYSLLLHNNNHELVDDIDISTSTTMQL